MRRLAALTAGVVLVFTTSGAVANAGAAPPPSAGVAYNSSTEYVCWMEISQPVPPIWSVYVGDRPRFTAVKDICSRATRQFLRQEIGSTYWTTSNGSVLSVGSAATNPVTTVTLTATGPGSATITAIARRASFSNTDVTARLGLDVLPRPFDVSITGPSWVMHMMPNTCWWYAQVSRGTPPFSYAWYFDGARVSTEPAVGLTNIRPGSYGLALYVTDASGATVSTTKQFVTTSSWVDLC